LLVPRPYHMTFDIHFSLLTFMHLTAVIVEMTVLFRLLNLSDADIPKNPPGKTRSKNQQKPTRNVIQFQFLSCQ